MQGGKHAERLQDLNTTPVHCEATTHDTAQHAPEFNKPHIIVFFTFSQNIIFYVKVITHVHIQALFFQ